MAGDWIKIRECLHEDPAVLAMAERLETSPETVVGYLVKFWSWVSRNSSNGCLGNVRKMSLDCLIGVQEWSDALIDVGWLVVDKHDRMTIPKFDKHLSNSAKARAENAARKRKYREKTIAPPPKERPENVQKMSHGFADKNRTREEKRREESIEERKCKKKEPASPPTVDQVVEYVSAHNLPIDARDFVDYYSAQGWKLANGRPLVDWQAAARRWGRQRANDGGGKSRVVNHDFTGFLTGVVPE